MWKQAFSQVQGVKVLAVVALLTLTGSSMALAQGTVEDVQTQQIEDASPTDPIRFVVGFNTGPYDHVLDRLMDSGALLVVPLSTIDAAVVLGAPSVMEDAADWEETAYVEGDGSVTVENHQTAEQTGEGAVKRGDPPLSTPYTGEGVTIALVDLGVDTDHPDLDGQVIKRYHFDNIWALEGIVDEDTRDWWAESSPGFTHKYLTSHGLLTSGIMAGTGALDASMEGVAPGAKIIDYDQGQVSPYISLLDEVAGLGIPTTREASGTDILLIYDHMIRHKDDPGFPGGIRIASNSWAVDQPEEALKAILRKAVEEGISVVNSAGNAGPGEDTISGGNIKKDVEELILVAASCPAIDGYDLITGTACGAGDVATYSSRGEAIDIAAPGAGIWAPSVATSQGDLLHQELEHPPYKYSRFGGTSAAQAYTAGVIALMLEANPELVPSQIEQILKDTATTYDNDLPDTTWGHGEVHALQAVVAALEVEGTS